LTLRTLHIPPFDLTIEAPPDADALVHRAQSEGNIEHGYWAHLWPSALTLAHFIARTNLIAPGMRILEIGCGLGLVGLMAAKRGAVVTLTDYSDEALAAARRNAELNHLTISTARFDWNDPPDSAWKPDLLLGADVLYSPYAHEPIAQLITQLDCTAILGYPSRPATATAIGVFEHHGLRVWDTPTESGRVMMVRG
jgi:predicted nicotinamide N-methyase